MRRLLISVRPSAWTQAPTAEPGPTLVAKEPTVQRGERRSVRVKEGGVGAENAEKPLCPWALRADPGRRRLLSQSLAAESGFLRPEGLTTVCETGLRVRALGSTGAGRTAGQAPRGLKGLQARPVGPGCPGTRTRPSQESCPLYRSRAPHPA